MDLVRVVGQAVSGPAGISVSRTRMLTDIAFIVGQLSLGGAEQQLYYLLSSMDRSRFRPMVISLGPMSREYWQKPIGQLGILVRNVPRRYGRAFRLLQIATILRSRNFQMVHSWDLHTNPYSAVAARLACVPLCIGSMRFNYEMLSQERLLRWIGYSGLDVLVTNSISAADQVQEFRLTTAAIRLVPNGVYMPEPINPIQQSRLKSELGCSNTDSLIGTIGRIDNNKNHFMLLRAFTLLTEKWPNLRLVIIGDGPLKSQLARMADKLGVASKIRFPGAIPTAARYFPAMDVCCLTSYTEGMPNVVMEAAAAGLPVVATRCGDTVDLIEHGVSGYLVEPDDEVGMSACLDLLLANPENRFRMGQAGREKMRSQFSIEAMVARMTQVYDEVLAN